MKVERVKITDQEKMAIVKEIRMQVFIIEQNVPYEEDWDEEESENYIIYNDQDIPVGTMRWRDLGDIIKIERVSVLKEHRGRGYGELLMRCALDDLKLITSKPITLHSQLLAIPLYERLGFEKYGEIFYEAEIPHYAMKLIDKHKKLKELINNALEEEDNNKAIKQLSNIIEVNPHLVEAYYARASLYVEKEETLEKAIADHTKIIELTPCDGFAYFFRAEIYAQNKATHKEAIEDYNRAIELEPENSDFYFCRAEFYSENNEEEKAEADYLKAEELEAKQTLDHNDI